MRTVCHSLTGNTGIDLIDSLIREFMPLSVHHSDGPSAVRLSAQTAILAPHNEADHIPGGAPSVLSFSPHGERRDYTSSCFNNTTSYADEKS